MNWLILTYLTVFGVFFGSFLNVVVDRTHASESWWTGRSICPDCRKILSWKELIPIFSFLVQRGKCKSCGKKISYQYPLVEIATGLITFLIFSHFGLNWEAVLIWFLGMLLLGNFLSDLFYMELPDEFSIPSIVIALLHSIFFQHLSFSSILYGILFGSVFFIAQYVITKGKGIGSGDIRIGIIMGALLGWPLVLFSIMSAYIGGSLISILLLATKKLNMKSALPLGVFLIPALVVTFVYEPSAIALINRFFMLNIS